MVMLDPMGQKRDRDSEMMKNILDFIKIKRYIYKTHPSDILQSTTERQFGYVKRLKTNRQQINKTTKNTYSGNEDEKYGDDDDE